MMEREQLMEVQAEVRELYPNVQFPKVLTEPIYYGYGTEIKKMEDKVAVVTYSPTGEENVTYIGSKGYQIMPHEVVVWNALNTAKELGAKMGPFELVPQLTHMGSRLQVKMVFNDKPMKCTKGDEYNPMAIYRNSYDGLIRHEASAWTMRCVCSNGMCLHTKKFGAKQRHLKNSLNYGKLADKLMDAFEALVENMLLYRAWNATRIPAEHVNVVFNGIPLAQKHKEGVLALTEMGSKMRLSDVVDMTKDDEGKYVYAAKKEVNPYVLFNATTQYVEHELPLDRRIDTLPRVGEYFRKTFSEVLQ